MFFRGRGTTYLAERDAAGVTGPAIAICQDVLTIALKTNSGEHINKCGPVDSPDDRYIKDSSGTLTLDYSDIDDKKFAIGVLGTLQAAAGSPSAVSGELLPVGLANGDVYFLGGLARHRAITALVLTDSDSAPATLVLNTDYTLEALSGRVTFIADLSALTQPIVAAYSHTDPEYVSMLSAPQKQYIAFFEFINLRNNNKAGSLEVYSVRFDPTANADFLSADLQVMNLVGTMLADPSKPIDDVLGQFGRRIL